MSHFLTMFSGLTLPCPHCAESMSQPMQMECGHNVCPKCIDALELAEETVCALCQGRIGVPVLNVALAAALTEAPFDEQATPPEKRAKVCGGAVPEPLASLGHLYDTQLVAVRQAAVTLVAAAAAEEAAFAAAVRALHEDLDVQARKALAVFKSAVRVTDKQLSTEEASAEAHAHHLRAAAAAGLAGTPGVPRPAVVPSLTATLSGTQLRQDVAAAWREPEEAYELQYRLDGVWKTACALLGTPTDIMTYVMRKGWAETAPRCPSMLTRLLNFRNRVKYRVLQSMRLERPNTVSYIRARNVFVVSWAEWNEQQTRTTNRSQEYSMDTVMEYFLNGEDHCARLLPCSTKCLRTSSFEEGHHAPL